MSSGEKVEMEIRKGRGAVIPAVAQTWKRRLVTQGGKAGTSERDLQRIGRAIG